MWRGLAHKAWDFEREMNFTCLPIVLYPDTEVSMGEACPRPPMPRFLLPLSFDSTVLCENGGSELF